MRENIKSVGVLILRVTAGLMMATHGYGKVFGGNMEQFAGGVGEMGFPFPLFFAWVAALSEFLGGIGLALGLGTRISAAFVAGTMFVACFVRHAADPLAVKELAILYLAIMLFFMSFGGGKWAVERLICKK